MPHHPPPRLRPLLRRKSVGREGVRRVRLAEVGEAVRGGREGVLRRPVPADRHGGLRPHATPPSPLPVLPLPWVGKRRLSTQEAMQERRHADGHQLRGGGRGAEAGEEGERSHTRGVLRLRKGHLRLLPPRDRISLCLSMTAFWTPSVCRSRMFSRRRGALLRRKKVRKLVCSLRAELASRILDAFLKTSLLLEAPRRASMPRAHAWRRTHLASLRREETCLDARRERKRD